MMRFLAIDQGTTGTRATLFDERLRPQRTAYHRLDRSHPRPGWVEQDGEAIAESVLAAAREAAAGQKVDAAALANQGESVLAWDSSGTPLSPVIGWQCRRSESIVDRVRESGASDEVAALSGLPLDPYFSSTKLTWLLESSPAVQAAAKSGELRLGTTDAWLRQCLSGEAGTDPTTASRTQLMNLDSLDWDDRLLEIFRVPRAALPPIQPTAADGLAELDLGPGLGAVPLCASIVDQQGALVGQGCLAPGDVKCTYGTGCFVLSVAGERRPASTPGLLPTVGWSVGGQSAYALDGGVLSAGACVDWLATLGIAADANEVSRLADEAGNAGGVRFLPALAGLGAPWWDPAARGVFAGLTEHSGRGQLACAVLDGIAMRVADIVETMRAVTGNGAALRVDGGLTSSGYLMRRQAELLGLPLRIAPDAEATVRGAAALAAVGAGLLPDVGAIPGLLELGEELEPSGESSTRAREREAWRTFLEGARNLG
jgi:glycerol kinase